MATNKPQIGLRLHPRTLQQLNACSEEKRIPKTSIIELALSDWFGKECPNAAPQPTQTSDDKPIYNAAKPD